MRVTRAPSGAAPPSAREHDRGRARAAARLEAGARARAAARRTRRRARSRAEPAAIASAPAASASMPAWAEPASSAPPTDRPAGRARRRGTARLGPSANGGRLVPQKSASTESASTPAAASAAVAASHARVRVSSSGAQAATWPRPPRPHAAPTSAAGQPQRGRRGADAPDPGTGASAGHRTGIRASGLLVIDAPKRREIRGRSLASRVHLRPFPSAARRRTLKVRVARRFPAQGAGVRCDGGSVRVEELSAGSSSRA